jgi:hypothetical protein
MAKRYGTLFYVYGARPKNPLILNTTLEWEIWSYENLYEKDMRKSIDVREKMMELGYDGIIIKGREMVNYNPVGIKYFRTEKALEDHYQYLKKNSLLE